MKLVSLGGVILGCIVITLHAYKLPIDLFSINTLQKMGLDAESKIGLITNQSACDSKGKSTLDVLIDRGINVVVLLAAEHGLDGTIKAGQAIEDSRHARHQVPIMSLYKQDSKEVPENVLEMVDALLFDIQDVGMRHFTYSATLLKVLQACARGRKKLIVLDRPNPLGMLVEGPIAQPKSFLSSVPVAVRHGMTVGELALYCNKYVLDIKADLYVAPLHAYRRSDACTTLLKPLSPNIHDMHAVKGYSFLGLLGEIKPFDVGIGTSKPFQRIGLPEGSLSEQGWQHMAELLIAKGIVPYALSYERRGVPHKGFDLVFGDSSQVYGFEALIAIIQLCKKEKMVLQESDYFTASVGSSLVGDYIHGLIDNQTLVKKVCEQHGTFLTRLYSIALYEPLPRSRWCTLINQPTFS